MMLRAATSGLTRTFQTKMNAANIAGSPRRSMSIWTPLFKKPYTLKEKQQKYLAHKGPTYLRGGTIDDVIVLGSIAGITLTLARVICGYEDMALGRNKLEIE